MSASSVLGTAVLELKVDDAELKAGIEGAKNRVEGFRGSLVSAGQSMQQTGQAMTIVSAGALAMGAAVLKTGIDYESAFAGVRKTVNATETEFSALSTGIREMALEVPASASSIASVAEAAGQLGIQTPNILGFTRTMVDLGVSTNMTAEQAATSLARLANITQMPQTEFDRLGSTVVALGNNFATTESEIVEMGLRIAGAGHTVGMTEPQIMGFAAALSSVGIEAQAGGSAISRVMIDMASEVAQGGAKLETFASVAGMTSAEFQRAFQEDASGAIVSFIEGLGGIQAAGGDVFGVLDELGLSEIRVRDALLRAAGAGDLFRNAIELGSTAWQENTALTNEAAQRYETTASQIQIMKNRLSEAALELSTALIPMFQSAVDVVGRFAGFLSGTLIPAFNGLPGPVKTFAIALGALLAVAGPLLVVTGLLVVTLGTLSLPVLAVAAAVAVVGAGLITLEMHTGLVSKALGLLATAVRAAADAFVWLWDQIKAAPNWVISKLFGDTADAADDMAATTVAAADQIQSSMGDLGDGLHYLPAEAERMAADWNRVWDDLGSGLGYTQSEVDVLVGRASALGDAMMGMGSDAVAAVGLATTAVVSGMSTSQGAVDAFVQNGKIRYSEFREAAESELQGLRVKLAEALAAPEPDPAEIAAIQAHMDAINGIIAASVDQAGAFGRMLDPVAEAYRNIGSAAGEAAAHMDEWNNRGKMAGDAIAVLDQQLADGRITQDQYNASKEQLVWLQERSKGGALDEAGAFVESAVQTAEFTRKLDELNAQYEDKSSDEYRIALAGLTAQYDPAASAGLQMAQSLGALAESMDTTIEKIVNLLVQLGIFDETQAEAVLGVDASGAEQGAADATTAGDEFAAGDYMAAFEGDDTHAVEKAHNASDAARTFADADYTATLKADNQPAVTPTEYARGRATGFAEGDYTATLDADNSGAISGINEVESRLAGVTRSFTIYADLDYTALSAGLARVEGLLPHSPAKWGPLAFQPDWSYITATFTQDTLPAVEHGVGALSNTFRGQRRNWWQYGRDLGEQYAGGIADSTPEIVDAATDASEAASEGVVLGITESRQFQGESFLRELNAFSKFVIDMVADTASEFEDGMLDAASAYMDAAKQGYDLFEQGLALIAQLDASNANLGRAMQAATDLKVLTEHIVVSLGDSVALIDASRPEGFVTRAGEYADAAKTGVDLVADGADLLVTLSDLNANLERAKDAASQIKFLTEHIVTSIGDSAWFLDSQRGEGFVADAEQYAESAKTGLDLMDQGAAVMATLMGLSGDLDAARDGASQVKFLTEHIMLSIGDSADYITATRGGGFIERAGSYAETATSGMELMTAASEALASLQSLVDTDFAVATEAASQVKFLTEHIVQSLGDSAVLFSSEGLAHLQEYVDASVAAYGLMGDVVAGVEAILTFAGMKVQDADLRDAADRMIELTQYIVAAMQESSANFNTAGLTAVTEYAEAANSAMDTMGGAGDALNAMLLFSTIDTTGYDLAATADQMVALVELITRQLEAVAVLWDTKGLDAVSAFSESANAGLEVMKTTGEALAAILMYGDLDPKTRENLRQLAWEMTGVADYILDMLRQIAANYSTDALDYLQQFADVASDLLGLVKGAADAFKAMVDHSRVTQAHADAFLASWQIVIDLVQDVAQLASTQGVQEALRFLNAVQEIAALIQAANATIAAVQPADLPAVPSTGATTTNTTTTTATDPKADTTTGLVGVAVPKDDGTTTTGGWNPDPVGTDNTITRAAKGIELPKLALGGVVTRELDATVAERGVEAVIPLESAGASVVASALVDRMRQSPEWAAMTALSPASLSATAVMPRFGGDDIDLIFNAPVTINARDREDAERAMQDIGWGIRAAKRRRGAPV